MLVYVYSNIHRRATPALKHSVTSQSSLCPLGDEGDAHSFSTLLRKRLLRRRAPDVPSPTRSLS